MDGQESEGDVMEFFIGVFCGVFASMVGMYIAHLSVLRADRKEALDRYVEARARYRRIDQRMEKLK